MKIKSAELSLAAAAVLAAGITLAPPLAPAPGDQCQNWHATTTDSSGSTLVCTHTPDSGHVMYCEPRVMDR
jgi:hypothetical protein